MDSNSIQRIIEYSIFCPELSNVSISTIIESRQKKNAFPYSSIRRSHLIIFFSTPVRSEHGQEEKNDKSDGKPYFSFV